MPALPPPTPGSPYRIELVCLGNICRSPMAHVTLAAKVAAAGLADRVQVTSSGIGDWHVGRPMDHRAAATLTAAGYDASRHRAQQYDPRWLEERDLVLAMDESNLANVLSTRSPGGPDGPSDRRDGERVRLFREFDPLEPGGAVPDPYYGGDEGFEEVLAMVERTAAALVVQLHRIQPTGATTS